MRVHNTSEPRPDARVKVPPQSRPTLAKRIKTGEKPAQVAADYGISERQARTIATKEVKLETAKAEREHAAFTRKTNCGVIHGDFRVGAAAIDDASVDLFFTDPPYNEESVGLYQDIASMAAKKLVPGGWLLAYTGHVQLPAVLQAFSETPGLEYGWTFCIVHAGGDLRFRKFKIQNKWKPIVGCYRPPLSVTWDWFPDVASGGKEKAEHPWQQAVSEAAHFIAALTPTNGLVFDPCCGSGTTLLAARDAGRKWLGYEILQEHVETARSRLDD